VFFLYMIELYLFVIKICIPMKRNWQFLSRLSTNFTDSPRIFEITLAHFIVFILHICIHVYIHVQVSYYQAKVARVAQWLERRRRYVANSNSVEGHGCRSFRRDRAIRGPVSQDSQQVWHVKEHSLLKAINANHKSNLQTGHR
jgi:hypothetical protein